jgi:uncharacterized phage infection (PIP) family protein YhgE
MQEIVNAVTRVTDIMGEIASASDEQSKGIEQVSLAVSQMDSVTQQNASLVQESAAASAALEEQAEQLRQAVAVFRVNGHSTLLQSKPGKPTIAPRTAVTPPHLLLATATGKRSELPGQMTCRYSLSLKERKSTVLFCSPPPWGTG